MRSGVQWQPTLESDRPVFKQIADGLRQQIQAGELGEGQQLPSESELMAAHGAARGTVRQAIMLLKGEGLVLTEHGRGAFVRLRPPLHRVAYDRFSRAHREAGKAAFLADAEASGYAASVDSLVVRRERASAEVARRLGVRAGSGVVVRERRYLADGQPVELATSYIPGSIGRGTAIEEADSGPGGIYARIEEQGHRSTTSTRRSPDGCPRRRSPGRSGLARVCPSSNCCGPRTPTVGRPSSCVRRSWRATDSF